jgi:eukaryotic-like serine/threonine-protein kinase
MIGQYRITNLIGTGGMGVVYGAEHTLIGRAAAVKVLLPEFSQKQSIVARFFNEAKAATAIRHPGIVEVYDFGWHTDGSAYIVMEYLEGETLASRRKRMPMSWPAILAVTRQIAGALQAAHTKGIVHRDLKPDNVFIVSDPEVPGGERIKLLDFGIAKLADDQTNDHKTRTGAVIGTPKYMAPEQCRGVPVDHRADLYSLGVMMFVLGTGRAPFVGEGAGDVLAAHIHVPPPLMSSLVANVPPEIEALVQRLLVKAPADRLQSAEELIFTIDAITAKGSAMGSSPSMTPLPAVPFAADPPTRPSNPTTLSALSGAAFDKPPTAAGSGRSRTVAVAALVAAALGGVAIAFSMKSSHDGAAKPVASSEPPPAVALPAAAPTPATPATPEAPAPAAPEPLPTPSPTVAAPAAPEPATVELAIASTPDGAIVLRDGAQLGVTPFHGTLPHGDAPVKLTLRKSGYKDKVLTVVPAAALDETVKLEPRPRTTRVNRDQSVNPF